MLLVAPVVVGSRMAMVFSHDVVLLAGLLLLISTSAKVDDGLKPGNVLRFNFLRSTLLRVWLLQELSQGLRFSLTMLLSKPARGLQEPSRKRACRGMQLIRWTS